GFVVEGIRALDQRQQGLVVGRITAKGVAAGFGGIKGQFPVCDALSPVGDAVCPPFDGGILGSVNAKGPRGPYIQGPVRFLLLEKEPIGVYSVVQGDGTNNNTFILEEQGGYPGLQFVEDQREIGPGIPEFE